MAGVSAPPTTGGTQASRRTHAWPVAVAGFALTFVVGYAMLTWARTPPREPERRSTETVPPRPVDVPVSPDAHGPNPQRDGGKALPSPLSADSIFERASP